MRLILFSLIINFCSIAFAQKENLKLEDAILGRWDKFSTDKIQGLQWVKNNNEYSYIKDNILFIESLEGITRQLLLSNLNAFLEIFIVIVISYLLTNELPDNEYLEYYT